MQGPTQNPKGPGGGNGGSTIVEIPEVLAFTHRYADRNTSAPSPSECVADSIQRQKSETPPEEKAETTGLQSVRCRLKASGISDDAADIIMSSWRPRTRRMYDMYIKKWTEYANERQADPHSPPLEEGVNFLAKLIRDKASLSAVCTARSALSCYLCKYDGVSFGSTELVRRLIKGAFEENPTLPRQKETWDVNTVLDMLNTWVPLDKLTLKELTLKLVVLIALLTGQRYRTIHALDITCMSLKDDKCTFFFVNTVLKHTRRGTHLAPIELHAFPNNGNLCVITTLKEYLRKTSSLREKQCSTELFIGL